MRHESNDTGRVQVLDVSDNDLAYASESLVLRGGEPGVFPTSPGTIWRAGTDGVAPFMQLTTDAGWLPGSIAFLDAP